MAGDTADQSAAVSGTRNWRLSLSFGGMDAAIILTAREARALMARASNDNKLKGSPGHRLSHAVVGVPLTAVGTWLGRGSGNGAADENLGAALGGELREMATAAGRLAYYVDGPEGGGPPLLLVHSINAAGSSYEVRPLYELYRQSRRVYSLDLPGFGFSDRSDRIYTPRLMTDAVLAMVAEIEREHGTGPIDALALSLSCEFLARAASERTEAFRSLALISPTGFDRRAPRLGPPGSTRAMPGLRRFFTFAPWRRPFFDLLTSRASIRYFLRKTWGSKDIDEGLLAYDRATTRPPGAEHAPYCFISGFLFSNDITRVYDSLALPVWMAHGTRGDFTDYSHVGAMTTKPNWTIDVFETGALPHFEMLDRVDGAYRAFLARVTGGTALAPG
jgi:pimeloyl-ACP methyl ester carboxylesterase